MVMMVMVTVMMMVMARLLVVAPWVWVPAWPGPAPRCTGRGGRRAPPPAAHLLPAPQLLASADPHH